MGPTIYPAHPAPTIAASRYSHVICAICKEEFNTIASLEKEIERCRGSIHQATDKVHFFPRDKAIEVRQDVADAIDMLNELATRKPKSC